MNKKKTSRKTTWMGLVAAIGTLLIGIAYAFDGNPNTVVDASGLTAALGVIVNMIGLALGGLWQRDRDVSSEDEGAQ